MKKLNKTSLFLTAALSASLAASSAHAQQLEVTPTQDAQVLRDALMGASSGEALTITSASYVGAAEAAATFRNGPQSLADGILLTSGRAVLALPPNDSEEAGFEHGGAGTELCSGLTTPHDSFDVARLTLTFTLNAPFSGISFQSIFGSEEYPEYLGESFNDAYGVFLDGVQVAFDENGQPITINGPFFASDSVVTETQTQYDGSTSVLTTRAPAEPGEHTLDIVICDAGDQALDSGVFLSNLSGCIGNECTSTVPCELVDGDEDGVNSCDDCNDGDASTFPGAQEVCDEVDNNCDGQIDEGLNCCPDEDEDGVCDEDDVCALGDDNADADQDLVPDACDNCPETSNPGQEDEDADGKGDACAVPPEGEDQDEDGVPNEDDECQDTPAGEVVNQAGCSVSQLCPCDDPWTGKDAYVACVSKVAREFVQAGLISCLNSRVLIYRAKHSQCGVSESGEWRSWWTSVRSTDLVSGSLR